MIKYRFLLMLLLGFNSIVFGQNKTEYTSIDFTILGIPDSLTNSSQQIANYINSNFFSPEDKLRAIYTWVAKNIQYDIKSRFVLNEDEAGDEINRTLVSRKGVCGDYARLFSEIANRVGIRSYVVTGYSKQYKDVIYNPHSWCAAMIGYDWYLFDPTWGSGSIQDTLFVQNLNYYFYKVNPKQFIRSHMPFDPLWQFLNNPISNFDFCTGNFKDKKGKVFFSFNDTLKTFEQESEIERINSMIRRIESCKVNSYLIYSTIQNLQSEYYNKIVAKYNEGLYQLNKFIDYRNNQFIPYVGDTCIQQMLGNIDASFSLAIKYIEDLKQPTKKTKSSLYSIRKSIEGAIINLSEQKKFLEKYLNTYVNYRKSLFYDKM